MVEDLSTFFFYIRITPKFSLPVAYCSQKENKTVLRNLTNPKVRQPSWRNFYSWKDKCLKMVNGTQGIKNKLV